MFFNSIVCAIASKFDEPPTKLSLPTKSLNSKSPKKTVEKGAKPNRVSKQRRAVILVTRPLPVNQATGIISTLIKIKIQYFTH